MYISTMNRKYICDHYFAIIVHPEPGYIIRPLPHLHLPMHDRAGIFQALRRTALFEYDLQSPKRTNHHFDYYG